MLLGRIAVLAICAALAGACSDRPTAEPEGQVPSPRPVGRTLGEAMERGALRVLMLPRSEAFLPRDGESTLRERSVVEAFAEDLGLAVEFVPVDSLNELIPALLEKRGDLIASNFTNTPARSRRIVFSSPIAVVREQVVTRSSDDLLGTRRDLAGRRLAVLRGSSHFDSAIRIAQNVPGMEIETAEAGAVTEDLLDGVDSGRFDTALVDSNLMRAARTWHPELRVAFSVGEPRMIAWGMRPGDTELRRAVDSFLARSQIGEAELNQLEDSRDLPGIRERGRLRVLTRNAATTYFVWRGELVGFEYELARRFAESLGIEHVEMVVPPRAEDLVPWLLAGKGDLIAAGLTRSAAREKREGVRFSRRYLEVREVVVVRDDDPVEVPADLAGRTFHVRRDGSHWDTLQSLKEALGFRVVEVPAHSSTEEIIARVASGEYDLTLADDHRLEVERALRDDVRGAFALGLPRELGWAVDPDHPELLAAIDAFWAEEYKGLFYNVTARKYFGSDRELRRLANVPAHRTGQISPWDDLVRKYAAQYGFDWRLVVAQMHQESRFDPEAESFAGAQGLLQVMPNTARQMGFDDLHDPETGIHAGIRYLSWVRDRFEPTLAPAQRIWFALAAYNAGPGHVRDARQLARERGLDPNIWFDNVETAMALKRDPVVHAKTRFGYCNGEEPIRYVRAISERYEAYVQVAANARPEPAAMLVAANDLP